MDRMSLPYLPKLAPEPAFCVLPAGAVSHGISCETGFSYRWTSEQVKFVTQLRQGFMVMNPLPINCDRAAQALVEVNSKGAIPRKDRLCDCKFDRCGITD